MAEKRRRKSLSLFRPTLPTLAAVHHRAHDPPSSSSSSPPADSTAGGKKKLHGPASFFTPAASPASPASPRPDSSLLDDADQPDSPKTRPRTLHKGSRTSVFGSLRSLHSLDDDDRLAPTRSKESSADEEEFPAGRMQGLLGQVVLHHGEVPTTGGMFRKRNQYLVLTETHLVRFKSQARAAEMFPTIPASLGRSNTRPSMSSVGSFQEMQMAAYADITSGISLNNIIAVYKLDDGRPYFSIEVSHLDDKHHRASIMHMQLNDPREAELWLGAIRQAAQNARLTDPTPLHRTTVEHVARVLELERDYDPARFQVFKVAQRTSNRATGRSSSDDLAKLSSTICYLAVGVNRVHLVPLPKSSTRSSSTSLSDLDSSVLSFGITTLVAFSMQSGDDAFQITFRMPLKNPFAIHLASCVAREIALWLRHSAEYLRPEWVHQPFAFNVPRGLEDETLPQAAEDDEHKWFDRTLVAYCAGYHLDTSNISYTIDYRCEDAPCFRLLSPTSARRQKYAALELIAVLRALRYNESFTSISFAGINLDGLADLYDPYGPDFDALKTRSGTVLSIAGQEELSLLSQEVRALALKSKRLRRLDFSYCLTRTPTSERGVHDPGCGIPEALFPLCTRSLTNVDWVVLTGIRLGDTDLDYLVDAASRRVCHLRALEVGDCGLSVHELELLLSTLTAQESTLEAFNISGIQGRISPETFQQHIAYFGHIRKLNMTRIQRTSGSEPLIGAEILLNWRLEELLLSQTPINEETVDAISTYLASPRSNLLRHLHLDQCGLSGKDVAIFFRAMSRDEGRGRDMHVQVSENRLRIGYSSLFESIEQNTTPTVLTMRMVEFEKEHHFRQLVRALSTNRTLKALDISKASLPYDAGDETCEALKQMFAENETLEELDISGEHAHLDSARFGIGLNLALTGLKRNKTLKVLKIEHQKLGLQGANTLAEVLEANDSLVEVHCEHNELNLQSFTVLVNALQKNTTVLYLPPMTHDRELSLDKVRREIANVNQETASHHVPLTGTSLKRTLTASLAGKTVRAPVAQPAPALPPAYTEQDLQAVLRSLNDSWDVEVSRLQRYLVRNHRLAHGLPLEGHEAEERPKTARSLGDFLESVTLDRTPTLEKEVGLGLGLGLDEKQSMVEETPARPEWSHDPEKD